ncbi:uncharacterized protein LOC130654435 isoform X2 [Hydractinia symbiolongicarpus]|uniref:uncharacterized protein LOC130654435 isoform X2 n=1 Tax=Hydractinia symbiolongicarpus TaxID=13093 RepID=UPI00254C1544|nr:uncharacterized protein LOC130654435 isoform X2 [Hydractinia symbiolongicarpus]
MSTAKRSTARSLPCVLEDSAIHDNQQNGTGIFSSLYATELVGRFKIAVIGDKGCGKTSLLNSFVNRRCEFDVPLLFEEGVSTVRSGTKHVDFVIWDLSGCIEYDGLRYELYKDTDMFLICFDIGDFSTLQNVTENWIPELASYEPNIPFILVGCKHDLRSNSNINNNNNNSNNNINNKNNNYDNNNNNNNNNKNNSNINNINNNNNNNNFNSNINNNNNSNNNNNNINNEGSFSSSTNEELKYTVDKETFYLDSCLKIVKITLDFSLYCLYF